MTEMTRDELLKAVKEAAKGESSLTSSEFVLRSGVRKHVIYKLFPDGGWKEVLRLAGLKDEGSRIPMSDDEMIWEFHRVVRSLGRIPTWNQLGSRSKIPSDTIRKRFGGTSGTLKYYRDWLIEVHPDSPLIKEIDDFLSNQTTTKKKQSTDSIMKWPKTNGTEYGEPINFRGLRHAPINELGVVYLFGVIAEEMGFLVEALHPSYPDCEAKRKIKGSGKRWQSVFIEFEYRSSNFIEHGHDAKLCDMIVCWEHDWRDCPKHIEIIELRDCIKTLQA